MDLSYLLFLQDLRNATNNALTPFMNFLSDFAVSFLILLPTFIYWCWDKKRGLLTFAALYLSVAITSFIKLTACVYRPWIRDPRIIPAGKMPSSYSFPSGHTSMATPIYLGSATVFWQKKQTKILAVLCVILALLTGFSRNYLGVHTPQDVLVGFVISLFSLWAAWKLGAYLEKHPEKENKILLITSIICVIALVYTIYKPYPMDYDSNGKLLVNPKKMLKSAFEGFGALFAFCVARYVEKTWIKFKETGLNLKGWVCGIIGIIGLVIIIACTKKPIESTLGANWGRLTFEFIVIFYTIALYPLVIKKFFSKKEN